MKYGQYERVPKELTKDENSFALFLKRMRQDLVKSSHNIYRKLINFSIKMSEQDGDCFIRNEVAVIVVADSFKRPRIVGKRNNKKPIEKIIRFINLRK